MKLYDSKQVENFVEIAYFSSSDENRHRKLISLSCFKNITIFFQSIMSCCKCIMRTALELLQKYEINKSSNYVVTDVAVC